MTELQSLNADVTLTHETDTIQAEIEIEHTIGMNIWFFIGLVLILSAIGSFIMQFESEIRCSLGNQKVCATMQVKP